MRLNVDVDTTNAYLIDEQVPDGWTITNTSGDTSEDGHVTWCILQNAQDTAYTYNVTIPADIYGEFAFDGIYTFEGMTSEEKIKGDTYLNVESTIIPIITPAPSGDVTSKRGESVTFSISVNQIVNTTWYLNGTHLFANDSVNVNEASYTNSSGSVGTWNITVVVSNMNGVSSFAWIWTVEKKLSPCFIATAAYGTPLHGDINVLRDFRDEYLMTSAVGRVFVKVYYTMSPPIADVISKHEWLRAVVREGIVEPLVCVL